MPALGVQLAFSVDGGYGRASVRNFTVLRPGSTRAAAPDPPTRKVYPQPCFRVKCRVVDLITLLSRPEGKTLEFKRVISSPDGVLKAIVAFANTSGGVLVLGVEDGTKRVKGIPTYWRRKSVLPI